MAALAALALAVACALLGMLLWRAHHRLSLIETLERSRLEHLRLLELLPDAVLVVDDHKIVVANLAARRMLEVDVDVEDDPQAGYALERLVHPDDRGAVRRLIRASLRQDDAPPLEVRLNGDNGPIPCELSCAAIAYDGRASVALVVRDVSLRERLLEELRCADRSVAVHTLAANLGHEINNPLCVVLNNLEQVRDAVATSALADRDELMLSTTEAIDGAHRVHQIVKYLRTFAGGTSATSSHELDVGRITQLAIGLVKSNIRVRGTLVVQVADDLPTTSGDEGRLAQTIVCLLEHAISALPADQRADHELCVALSAPDGAAVLTVTARRRDGAALAARRPTRVAGRLGPTLASARGMAADLGARLLGEVDDGRFVLALRGAEVARAAAPGSLPVRRTMPLARITSSGRTVAVRATAAAPHPPQAFAAAADHRER